MEWLTPFLEAVKSPDTSGPVTLLALGALRKFVAMDLLGACEARRRAAARLGWATA